MYILLFLCFLHFLSAQSITISKDYTPPSAKCVDYDIRLTVSAKGKRWAGPKWNDNYDLTDFVSILGSRPDSRLSEPLDGSVDISGNYTLSSTFCAPKTQGQHSGTVLLATHGLGYDRSYWNYASEPEHYNFVQYATGQGYSVFFYDRLGTSRTSKLSGYVNQASIQVQIVKSLATLIKSGKYTDTVGIPKQLILLGHSFGSFTTQALLTEAPQIADAAILTGMAYSQDPRVVIEALDLRIANRQNAKWKGLDNGYVIWNDVFGNINKQFNVANSPFSSFFKAPLYTQAVANYSENTKVPFAIAELLTIDTLNQSFRPTEFKGPVLYFNGEYDFIVCGGYCPNIVEEPAKKYFSKSKSLKVKVQPVTGHGLNTHVNATAGYKVIFDFLKEQGL
ncbi:alpha/beta-hydrolase [Tothia fuscella]|uniref:Alpha/beta-hydrolase n=1 Tax=Tothia fuscella TaxID=1048955 RepID=A0A9P4NY45_9PEZI|nr:alpha/beta-hydrolase [Tothia fuscella]